MHNSHLHKNAWVVSVNMGYGHERAAFGLRDLAHGGVITANAYPGIPTSDKTLWKRSRTLYETISRLQPLPIVGQALFDAMDYFQQIPSFYPRRDLSQPTIQVLETYRLIEKGGLGKHLVDSLAKKNPLPFISTFFIPAFAAEVHGYPGPIYCVICDADVSRAWVPRDPKKSRIQYFAPNGRVVERLRLYGVPSERIFLTGFPLPKPLVGGPEGVHAKDFLAARISLLDPTKIFRNKYMRTLDQEIGARRLLVKPKRPVTVTFCVGGAGAQRQLGMDILKSLKQRIQQRQIRLFLEAGTRKEVANFFLRGIAKLDLKRSLGTFVDVHLYPKRENYFRGFEKTLAQTDILWTKPSELSFYTGLGLPIIIAPPIGSQEEFNKVWLKGVNGGMTQNDPRYTDEWLFDWIASGGLARLAWNGYIEAPTHGAYRIESLITGEYTPIHPLPLIV